MLKTNVLLSYILAFVFVIFINYMQIRDIIFSILRGSTSPKRARKIRKNQSFKDRVTMRYIAQYTKKNKKELTFYFFIKSIYIICCRNNTCIHKYICFSNRNFFPNIFNSSSCIILMVANTVWSRWVVYTF